MIESSKVSVRIEYESAGVKRVCYGEVDEGKLEQLRTGEESFICLLNDGEVAWVDKEAILSVYELETKLRLYEKYDAENASYAIKQGLKI